MPNWVSRAVLCYTEQQIHTEEVREDKKEDKGRGMSGHVVDCQHQLS